MTETIKKPIPGFPGYEADTEGNIWSLKHKYGPRKEAIKLRPAIGRWGYLRYGLCIEGVVRNWSGHKLVALAFHGQPLPNQQVRHLDGSKSNNRPDNLKWGTALENKEDKHRHGTANIGEKVHTSKLDELQVQAILTLHEAGWNNPDIAKIFDLNPATVSKIHRREIWCHVKDSDRSVGATAEIL